MKYEPVCGTPAVPEVHMCSWVVFAQALQDLLVVSEAVERSKDKDVQGDIADLLQLKLSAQTLQTTGGLTRLLQLQQNFRLLVQVCCQGLKTAAVICEKLWISARKKLTLNLTFKS